MNTLRNVLRNDRAESSIMVIIAQNVSLLVMVALGGLMFILITGGARIQAENSAQTELRIANRAFINDVDNANEILVRDDTSVTLSSKRFLRGSQDLDGDGKNDFVCRASTWVIQPAEDDIRKQRQSLTLMSVVNTVTIHATDDCKSAVISTQERVAVSAVTDDSRFVFTNIAGVNMNYSNGIATNFAGLDITSNSPPDVAAIEQFRADNSVSSWYTNTEMLSEKAHIIEAQLTAFLPITAENAASFKATTDQAVTELRGDNDNITDPGGEQTRWVPNPLSNVFFQRSPDSGTIVGGEREGIRLSWAPRPAYECSPIQTITYSWLLKNSRTGHQSSGETTSNLVNIETGDVGSAEVWNGGNYYAAVFARCNNIDGQSAITSTTGTLTLPDVNMVSVAANSAQTTHEITWNKVSSDPSTRYAVGYSAARASSADDYVKPAGGDVWMYPGMVFAPISGSPTVSTSITKTGNTVVAGFPDTYSVRASTADSVNTTGAFAYANFIYSGGTPAMPVITSITASSFRWSAGAGCASTTAIEYRAVSDVSGSNATATTLQTATPQTSTARSYSKTIGEGKRVFVRVDQRCSTKFTLDPTNGQSNLSPWGTDATGSYIRPVAAPDSISMNAGSVTVYNGTSVRRYGTKVNGCAAGTTAAWFGNNNGDITYTLNSATRYPSATGECRGDYATSPAKKKTVTIKWIPLPAPATPSGFGGNYAMTCDYVNGGYEGFSGTVSWASSDNATSYSAVLNYTTSSGNSATQSLGNSSARSRTFAVGASSNAPNVYVVVTAISSGGSKSSTYYPPRVNGGCV